jgi:dsDNA-specific endonuclease/ATPase MutS2|tara:strand:- start:366 stop:872 length:507 start_codon:yes stop_codon:yes gene_type:complete
MQFNIGDKVLFKTDNQKGKIIKINSQFKVTVTTEDGFDVLSSVKDLAKVEGTTDKITAYGKYFYQKDKNNMSSKSFKRDKSSKVLKIDLHIELLSINYQYLDNFEIVQIQLNECQKTIERAINSNIQKIIIIHGIGAGTLKTEVHKLLRSYDLRFYLTKDAGATEVML